MFYIIARATATVNKWKGVNKMKLKEIKELLVNNRYAVYFDNNIYVIYDTLKAQDIPKYVFTLADKIIQERSKIK